MEVRVSLVGSAEFMIKFLKMGLGVRREKDEGGEQKREEGSAVRESITM